MRRRACTERHGRWRPSVWFGVLALAALAAADSSAHADDAAQPAQSSASGAPSQSFAEAWFEASDAAKESQPHWMTPIVTVTPRLEQEFRYDQNWQTRPAGVDLTNYGAGKGLELIPLPDTEIILGVPAYETKQTPLTQASGWADETLLLKYRLLSGNEESGNYILTAFMGVSIPTGSAPFTNHHAEYTPTLAGGKGWGTRDEGFDIQTTLAYTIPDADVHALGKTLVWNTAFQAHLLEVLWPEIEVSATHFYDGANNGKEQVAITGGVILGRFALGPRARLIAGIGYQSPLTSFTTFGHTWLLTGRVAF